MGICYPMMGPEWKLYVFPNATQPEEWKNEPG